MPDLLNPITAIAGPESSFGQDLQNPNSTASGLYGMINSTWQANLAAIGGNPTLYPSAISAPNNLQTAVLAHLYNTRGFADYTCPNCDPVLTQSIANNGGPSAYLPQGSLSENPADYASLNTPGGLQAYFTANSGGSFIGSAQMVGAAAAPRNGFQQLFDMATGSVPAPAVTGTPTAKPFSYAYSLIVDTAAPSIAGNISHVQDLVSPWLQIALFIAVLIAGISTAAARMRFSDYVPWTIRLTLVSLFAAVGSVFYANYVTAIVMGIPATLSAAFGIQSAGPMAVFDDTFHTLWVITETILAETPVSFKGLGIVLLTTFGFAFGEAMLWLLAVPYLVTVFLLFLSLIFGPIAIVAALFRSLDRWLLGFADTIMTDVALLLAIDVVITIYRVILIQMLQGFSAGGNPDIDFIGFLGIVGVLTLMALSVYKYLPQKIARIFGGIGIRLSEGDRLVPR